MPPRNHLVAVTLITMALMGPAACSQNTSAEDDAPNPSRSPTETAPAVEAAAPASAPAQRVQRVQLKQTGLTPLSPPATLAAPASSKLQEIFASYLAISRGLVASDAKATRAAAASTLALVQSLPADGLPVASATAWKRQAMVMRDALKVMSNGDADLVAQHHQLARLSEALYAAAHSFNLKGSYVQFCPMANENAGAIWLSSGQEIRNPYFGESMLTCGETKEQI